MAKHIWKQKQPVAAEKPPSGKAPRIAFDPNDVRNRRPAWRFSVMDFEGPFHCNVDGTTAMNIHGKLKGFETMSWIEIESGGSHNVSKDKLDPAAKKRLATLKQDDVDELFSLRLTGKQRVWGIREVNVLKILWWDPEHSVCPAPKKHT